MHGNRNASGKCNFAESEIPIVILCPEGYQITFATCKKDVSSLSIYISCVMTKSESIDLCLIKRSYFYRLEISIVFCDLEALLNRRHRMKNTNIWFHNVQFFVTCEFIEGFYLVKYYANNYYV